MQCFVYVVCGENHYIEQTNLSMKFLRKFTDKDILLVTDTKRNEGNFDLPKDKILDIETPKHYSNNQASIYLETKLGDILDFSQNQIYCYLDSDMLAVSKAINTVFDHVTTYPIFARDHCVIDQHSPHAMQCNCLQEHDTIRKAYYELENLLPVCENTKDRKKLNNFFSKIKKQPIRHSLDIASYLLQRYISPQKILHLNNGLSFKKDTRTWHNQNGETIDYDKKWHLKHVNKTTGYQKVNAAWVDKDGHTLTAETPQCTHLREYLSKHYQLELPKNFRHWNGGLFVFDKRSIPALKDWHKYSLELLENPAFHVKYTDQVSLIITAYKHKFENKKKLPVRYNFICDYDDPRLKSMFQYDGYNGKQPVFLHVYHHWNDENWFLWKEIKTVMQ